MEFIHNFAPMYLSAGSFPASSCFALSLSSRRRILPAALPSVSDVDHVREKMVIPFGNDIDDNYT